MIDDMNRPVMPGEKIVPDAPGRVVGGGQGAGELWEICQGTQNPNKYFLVKVGRSMFEYGSVTDWIMPEGHTIESVVEVAESEARKWGEMNGRNRPKEKIR